VVVLPIARSALGAPQVLPTTAVTGLALGLSLLVMAPVAERAAALAAGRPGGGPVRRGRAARARGRPAYQSVGTSRGPPNP
jgi:type III secretion protein R